MRLDQAVYEKLNQQLEQEYQASNVYLQMAAWAESQDLNGVASFLYEHAEEERQHMRKIYDYILERDGLPIVPALQQPEINYKNVIELFDSVYKHEKMVTDSIHEIAHFVWEKKDLATFSFLQWFIDEQREEEALATEIVGKIGLIGTEGQGLYMIDEFVGSKAGSDSAA